MGPYCKFCDTRCFVPRSVPGSTVTILATCAKGMELDRESTGHDHETAHNPHWTPGGGTCRFGHRHVEPDEPVEPGDAHMIDPEVMCLGGCGRWVGRDRVARQRETLEAYPNA